MYARIIDMGGVQTVVELISDEQFAKILPPLDQEFQPVVSGMVLNAQLIDGVWIAPPAPVPDPPLPPADPTPAPTHRTTVSIVEYFGLFTIQEEAAIRAFAKGSDTNAGLVEVLLRRLDNPQVKTIEMDNPQVVAGIGLLVQLALLTQERADEILLGVPL